MVFSSIFSYFVFYRYVDREHNETLGNKLLGINILIIGLFEKVLENEVVILMTTDANLPKFSWGFVEKAITEFGLDNDEIF